MERDRVVLGLSAFYHDSAAALVSGGRILAAAQEERFTRVRHDRGFPLNATAYCLDELGASLDDVDAIAYYEEPRLKFSRILSTYLQAAPFGYRSFEATLPQWLSWKLRPERTIRSRLTELNRGRVPNLETRLHHRSHAASAFFPSPFDSAAVLCVDGVGERATTSLWLGRDRALNPIAELRFPHSLGLLYSAFTYFCGFRVDSGEYKVMGLAPYGEPRYAGIILDKLVELRDDGSFHLDMRYFDYLRGQAMTGRRFAELFGGPRREPEGPLTQREFDLAASIQAVTEEIMLRLARHAHRTTGEKNLCLAGGVALNCVANGRILRESPFDQVWVQPAAGDAGGAVGAALDVAICGGAPRPDTSPGGDGMSGALLGPSFSSGEIAESLANRGAVFHARTTGEMVADVARALAAGQVVGWFQGRMEFGPRALGNRSILGDPRRPEMQSAMNLKIKFRESFRPFAPSVLAGRCRDYFALDTESPYMLLVAPVHEKQRIVSTSERSGSGLDLLKAERSTIPAVTHVDHTARVQTVDEARNPLYHALLQEFDDLTGCPVLVNTSFNVRGEPIVCSPADAYDCFMRTDIDVLAIGDFLLYKKDQPESARAHALSMVFPLD
ncbi:carbamoyltransferase family protein [Amycolatopsis magusensis]|uniref:Carbamoyltransferase n=1 Tax=Amycolatopsis magusensis TaxID=882444 RepID=A0ABS4PWL5_9PSEU|nr:carbamoyltransferase [Amycolatopsis magusensis]MBP2183822.1 carbamoyltransferase [Amycolatopsis magusensis]